MKFGHLQLQQLCQPRTVLVQICVHVEYSCFLTKKPRNYFPCHIIQCLLTPRTSHTQSHTHHYLPQHTMSRYMPRMCGTSSYQLFSPFTKVLENFSLEISQWVTIGRRPISILPHHITRKDLVLKYIYTICLVEVFLLGQHHNMPNDRDSSTRVYNELNKQG